MTDQFKARTFINFPFTERRFAPGDMVDRSEFEEYASAAAAQAEAFDDERGGHIPTAQEQIDEFLKWGTISEDSDAEVLPEHLPPDPSKPTLAQLIEQARTMRDNLEAAGAEVPEGLKTLADTDYHHVGTSDNGVGGDQA